MDRGALPIPYAQLLAQAGGIAGVPNTVLFIKNLEDAWCSAYALACAHSPRVLTFEQQGFVYLFDLHSARGTTDDRVVAVYGRSRAPAGARDTSRQQGFLGGGIEIAGRGKYDKGHFMAHSMGGGMDVNFFPQRGVVNRGWSARGKVFRAMESYLAHNPGTLGFARPVYVDASWVPGFLDYGILRPDGTLWVETFEN